MNTRQIKFNPEDHEEFVSLRNQLHKEGRLGGSDVGVSAGVSKYKSPRRFYEEFVGNIKAPDISSKQSIKDGVRNEQTVADYFEERTGKKVHRVNHILVTDNSDVLFASIDRKVENEDAGLECKTANALNWDAFKDGRLPATYAMQVKTYMKVTGYRTWYVYVWVMGCAEYCYLFTMDDVEKPEWCDTLVKVTQEELDECENAANRFLYCVRNLQPPTEDGSDDETEVLNELFPESRTDEEIELVNVSESDIQQIDLLKEHIRVAETNIAEIENRIKDEMGEHAVAVCGGRRITWKNNKPTSKVDYKKMVADMNVAPETLKRYTELKPGARILKIGKEGK